LPVRLGLLNSAGVQDLIVTIVAAERYEVQNHPNLLIPTNIQVSEQARERFGAFYAALFDRLNARSPGAAVTEYAWDAGSCDPCPTPPLTPEELSTLGADVLPVAGPILAEGVRPGFSSSFVVTRLHLRYGKDTLGDDLVFRAAPPITGGRGMPGSLAELDRRVQVTGTNSFQARYAVLHQWSGPIECDIPERGRWSDSRAGSQSSPGIAAVGIGTFPRDELDLTALLGEQVGELEGAEPAPIEDTWERPRLRARAGGCAACSVEEPRGALGAVPAAAAALALLARRRRATS
jgi:hypothetical protein